MVIGRFSTNEEAKKASLDIIDKFGINCSIIRMPKIDKNKVTRGDNVSDIIKEIKGMWEDGIGVIELISHGIDIIDNKPEISDNLRRVIFTTFKDSEPEFAIPFGLDYVRDNADPKFLKVLLTRLLRNDREQEALELLLHRLHHDGETEHLFQIGELLFKFETEDILGNNDRTLDECTDRLKKYFAPTHLKEYSLHRMMFTGLRNNIDGRKIRFEIAEKYIDEWKNDESFMREYAAHEFQQGNISKPIQLLSEEFEDKRTLSALKKYEAHASLLEHGWVMPPNSPPSKLTKKNLVRYLIYTSLPHHSSGYATRTHNLLHSLNKGEWSVEGVTRYGYPWIDKKLKRNQVEDCEMVDGITYFRQFNEKNINLLTLEERLSEAADSFIEHCRTHGVPEVIHAASNWMNGVVACHAGKVLGVPVIYEVRGRWEFTRIARDPGFRGSEYDKMIRRMEIHVAKSCDKVLVITSGLKQMLIDEGVSAEKITIAPNGVDPEVFQPLPRDEELADELGIQDGPVVGYVGSLVHYEGLDLLIKAIGNLKIMGQWSGQVLIVGDGAEKNNLEKLADDVGVGDSCIFTGRVDFRDINRYYSLIDIAPFPRTSHEVCEMVSPLKPFEAMAMGKRVICSNVAALKEVIEVGVNGELFEKDDVNSLTTILGEMLNRFDRDNNDENVRSWVEQNRTWEKTADIIADVYDDVRNERPETVLIAGHDLKFIDGIGREMMNRGYNILQDKWVNHTKHDDKYSRQLLNAADIVICEWALGNSVWYSNNVNADHTLFIRFHRQEIETDYPMNINWDSVEKMIFIAPLIQQEAIQKFQIPSEKTDLLANSVDTSRFTLSKSEGAINTLGLMGMVPRMKRFDRALDILAILNNSGLDFQLRIKGKKPEEYHWMKDRPDEMEWYDSQLQRIHQDPNLNGRVHFDGWGNDVPEWFSEVGFILSVSDFEGSHQAVAEGAASGAIPIILEWPGASEVYPKDWCVETIDGAVDMIVRDFEKLKHNEENRQREVVMAHIKNEFDISEITSQWVKLFSHL